MKITNKALPTGKTLLARLIRVGTVFTGEISSIYQGHVYVRTYDGIVSLTDPNTVWGVGGLSTLEVKGYRPLDAELVVNGYAD
jgi:hypothetical protein